MADKWQDLPLRTLLCYLEDNRLEGEDEQINSNIQLNRRVGRRVSIPAPKHLHFATEMQTREQSAADGLYPVKGFRHE